MFQRLRLVMYLVQLVFQVMHQIGFNQTMAAQHLQGDPLALIGQSYTAIFSVIDRALFDQSLRHIRHGRRTHVQGFSQRIRRYALMLALQGIYSFQEVLYRLR